MKSSEALSTLTGMLTAAGVNLASPSGADLSKALTVFRNFSEIPVEDVNKEEDGDMVLFQYGTYDWGSGEFFEVDLVRRLMPPGEDGEEDDDVIFQLQCTFRYVPTDSLRALGSFDRWMAVGDENTFWNEIEAMPAFGLTEIPSSLSVIYGVV
jgi:hypothetical protein